MPLEVEEALQIIDDLLDDDLTPLQESIIKGIWENKHYQEIALDTYSTKHYIAKIACKLLQKISLALELPKDEKVNRSKLKFAIKKYKKHHKIILQDNQGVTFDCQGASIKSGNLLFLNQGNVYQTDLQETDNESEEKESDSNQ
ncbi:MAG TPA: hypothetical protein V6C58_00550 [Allocoleopsis sp.]